VAKNAKVTKIHETFGHYSAPG